MGDSMRLSASDNHVLDAYRVSAEGTRKGAVVIIQEIFGVNGHIRDVCDEYARAGYDAIAPALFDRIRPNVELDYTPEGVEEGREFAAAIGWEDPVLDIEAAARAVEASGRVAVIGYCWGASWTWVAAAKLNIACAVSYYGRHIVELLDEKPRCPVLMHFGAEDASIPLENVDKIRSAYPDIPIHVYESAGHGFNCDRRGDYRPEHAGIALERTLAFLEENL